MLLLDQFPRRIWRQFWLMPLMHAEDVAGQEAAVPLLERFSDPRMADSERRHRDVIARIGRFTPRNAALGRVPGREELGFLQRPESRYGDPRCRSGAS